MARRQGDLVGGVYAEALDVGVSRRRERGQLLRCDLLPSLSVQFADRDHPVQGAVEDDRVGQQGGELECLLLILGSLPAITPALLNRHQEENLARALSE